MKQNMGTIDRIIRVIFAGVVAALYFMGIINGTIAIVLGILAAVFILTSIVSFCPLYLPLKISTKK
ncbi:MAG: DUF2892 domain-containing protein [Spirochaetia bacterium]|nr:DUF2892 domain-containing protein [Spirochaetia bacterium]